LEQFLGFPVMSVSKTEFARALGVSAARITVFCRRGMPTLASGRIDPVDAADWIVGNVLAFGTNAPSPAVKRAKEILASRPDLTDAEAGVLKAALMTGG
jgi:hypothetical protein